MCPLDQVDQKLIVAFLPPNTPMLELLQLDWRHSVALQHRSMMSEKIFDDPEQEKDYGFAVGIVERLAQTIVASSGKPTNPAKVAHFVKSYRQFLRYL